MTDLSNIMVALDNFTKEQLLEFIKNSNGKIKTVKIGLELFCKHGPDIVHEIHNETDAKIFLDLKLHDIPNTVSKAIHSLKGLPISFLTIHLNGGRKMIEEAMKAKKESIPDTKILGVSYLTSLSENDFKEMWNTETDQISSSFKRIFTLAKETNIDGVVCSANELEIINELEAGHCSNMITVCPGIRFKDEIDNGNVQDQNRVMDPKNAFMNGAQYLVMGRSLTSAASLDQRLEELSSIISSL